MQKFETLSSIAAPIPLMNIDTDILIPKQFLKTIKRTGLGQYLFYDLRFDENDNEKPDFILNKTDFNMAQIIVAGKNFGCGSSREHAPWALLDFGIKCVIAPSFADIFYNNCFNNGILPVTLDQDKVDNLFSLAESKKIFTVDLEKQIISVEDQTYSFDMDPYKRKRLLEGLDEIAMTLEYEKNIKTFERRLNLIQPWLFPHDETKKATRSSW